MTWWQSDWLIILGGQRTDYMGKRPAEVELFVGNMGSMPREDTAFYVKRRIASHGNRTRTNSSESSE
jgi:hypothetical protein